MHKRVATGTIYLTTTSALALWRNEITGQLSDGMWENARPWEHWKFWSALESVHSLTQDAVHALPGCRPAKTRYNLNGLIEFVGGRMLNTGRLALAAEALDVELTYEIANAADYMPATLDDFTNTLAEVAAGAGGYAAQQVNKISPELAAEFYKTEYTLKDLRADLKRIKKAMKSAER